MTQRPSLQDIVGMLASLGAARRDGQNAQYLKVPGREFDFVATADRAVRLYRQGRFCELESLDQKLVEDGWYAIQHGYTLVVHEDS